MSVIPDTIESPPAEAARPVKPEANLLSITVRFLCSVRLGVGLLILLGLACFLGMVIMQQNVDGFERYFAELTPSQRQVYGALGLFDIYHVWYFNALLALLSLNIILASVDRFPKTWRFQSRPSVTVPVRWLHEQKQIAERSLKGADGSLIDRIAAEIKSAGWGKAVVTQKAGQTYIFGQSGLWNRFGAYAVHVALLTIFLGGFLTAQMGVTGQLALSPGKGNDLISETVVDLDRTTQLTKKLPFSVVCDDMQQKLITKNGSLSASNTVDWLTWFTITDENGPHKAMVQMNRPFDFRGYRFFQASFINTGRARNITLNVIPEKGGEPTTVSIPRNGNATLTDGTRIEFADFRADFKLGPEDPMADSSDYSNPAAILKITPPPSTASANADATDRSPEAAQAQTAYAFKPDVGAIPVASKAIGGYKFQLTDFEKVADQHILSVQRDPGATVVYIGFAMLFLTLVAVFFFSHQRVWVVLNQDSENQVSAVIGGHTNRNANNFDEKFQLFVQRLGNI